MNRIHFISSLFGSLRGEMSGRSEFSLFIDDARRQLERVASDVSRPAPARHSVDIRTA